MKYLIILAFLLSGCAPQKEIVYFDHNHNGIRSKWSFTRKVLKAHNVKPGDTVDTEVLGRLVIESLNQK